MDRPVTPTPARRRVVFIAANPSIDRLVELDSIVLGAINRPDLVVVQPGGKGLNAARAAFTLGGQVTALAILAGRAGDWIAERLAALGIDAVAVREPGAGETRTCLSALDRSTGRLTEFYEPGQAIQPTAWPALEEALAGQLELGDVGAVVCSGSLPPGAPPDGYARIVRLARKAPGGPVSTIVDSHGPPLEAALAEQPTVVKVNAAEAIEVAGGTPGHATGPDEALRAARLLLGRGAGRVVVTLGPDGAIACEGASAWRLRPPHERGRYPVGSGDAFVAALALALVTGASLVEAARRGIAAGTANAFLPGAGVLDPEVAGRLFAEVGVTQL